MMPFEREKDASCFPMCAIVGFSRNVGRDRSAGHDRAGAHCDQVVSLARRRIGVSSFDSTVRFRLIRSPQESTGSLRHARAIPHAQRILAANLREIALENIWTTRPKLKSDAREQTRRS